MDKSRETSYINNPFKIKKEHIKECFKRIDGGEYELADTSSGEVNVFRKAAKNKRVIVDTGNYVKVFKGNEDQIMSLGFMTFRLFYYISFNLKPHSDMITLECGIVCDYCSFGRSVFYASVNELLEKGIIARKKGSSIEFFVNINYVFNGSRLKIGK